VFQYAASSSIQISNYSAISPNVGNGAMALAFRLEDRVQSVRSLLRYRDAPMSLADACVVRMAELRGQHAAFSLGSDLKVYRNHGRTALALIRPADPGRRRAHNTSDRD
jgi:hypothetical protein